MQDLIDDLEQQHNIKILYACEAGSRVYGWEKLDGSSDCDLRFIYAKPLAYYLSIAQKKKQVIDGEYKGEGLEIDYPGWELGKALRLLSKSNPNLIEQIYSPTVYRGHDFQVQLRRLVQQYFNPVAAYWYYKSLAKSTWIDWQKETSPNLHSLKKLLIVARGYLNMLEICSIGIDYTKSFRVNGVLSNAIKHMSTEETVALESLVISMRAGLMPIHRGEQIIINWITRMQCNGELHTAPTAILAQSRDDLDEFFMDTVLSNRGDF